MNIFAGEGFTNYVTKADGSIDESPVVIEKPEAMYVFDSNHPFPTTPTTETDSTELASCTAPFPK